jgi:hypothetical protein
MAMAGAECAPAPLCPDVLAAELPAAELPVALGAELPAAELPAAELPGAELPADLAAPGWEPATRSPGVLAEALWFELASPLMRTAARTISARHVATPAMKYRGMPCPRPVRGMVSLPTPTREG